MQQEQKERKKLTGNDLHEAFRLDNPTAEPLPGKSATVQLTFAKVAQGLNIQLGLCQANDIEYLLSVPGADVFTAIEKDFLWHAVITETGEDDQLHIYMIQGGRLVGDGWYKMCQTWRIETIVECNQAVGLFLAALDPLGQGYQHGTA